MRRVEILEEKLKLGRQTFHKGDMVSLDDEVAQMTIEQGWAKCCETGEQNERKPGSVKLEVDSVVQKIQAL